MPFKQPVAFPSANVTVSAPDVTNNRDDGSDEASIAELGIKLFPHLPPSHAAAMWVRFVNYANTCLKHYNNNSYQGHFVYKHVRGDGFVSVEEPDGTCYYHMNFTAQDDDGRPQLFFGEIKACNFPKDQDVTRCCPVFPDDVGIRTIEAAAGLVFPDWNSTEIDPDHCYACRSRVKHPRGDATSQATLLMFGSIMNCEVDAHLHRFNLDSIPCECTSMSHWEVFSLNLNTFVTRRRG